MKNAKYSYRNFINKGFYLQLAGFILFLCVYFKVLHSFIEQILNIYWIPIDHLVYSVEN